MKKKFLLLKLGIHQNSTSKYMFFTSKKEVEKYKKDNPIKKTDDCYYYLTMDFSKAKELK